MRLRRPDGATRIVPAMGVFDRYVFRQLAGVGAFVTGALLLMVWLTQSLRFIDLIVNRGLPFGDFVYLLIFLVPWFLGIVIPIAVFVAVLFVYNRLSQESEIVACQACGLSAWRLARPALVLALVATVLAYAIMLYAYPASYHAFKNLQYEIRHDHSTLLIREGRFNDFGDDITIFIEKRTEEGALRNILVHRTADPKRSVTMMAERGALVRTGDGPRVLLEEGNRQVRNEETGELSILYFDRYTLDLGQAGRPLESRWRQPQERYLGQLLNPKETATDQRFRNELIAEGHERLTLPLYTVAFGGLGLAAVLLGSDRADRRRRCFVAVAVAGGLELGHIALKDVAKTELAAIAGMYLLAGLAVAVPLGLLAAPTIGQMPRRRRRESPAGMPVNPAP